MEFLSVIDNASRRFRYRLFLRKLAHHINDDPVIAEGDPLTSETANTIAVNSQGLSIMIHPTLGVRGSKNPDVDS